MSGYEPSLEQTINQVFGAEPFDTVDEQLFKCLIFLLTGNGRKIGSLNAQNFELFKENLDVLLPAAYRWHVGKIISK